MHIFALLIDLVTKSLSSQNTGLLDGLYEKNSASYENDEIKDSLKRFFDVIAEISASDYKDDFVNTTSCIVINYNFLSILLTFTTILFLFLKNTGFNFTTLVTSQPIRQATHDLITKYRFLCFN